jgi:hypothetical protein
MVLQRCQRGGGTFLAHEMFRDCSRMRSFLYLGKRREYSLRCWALS